MLTKVIAADTINRVVDEVLDELKEDAAGTTSSNTSRHNVIYFDGWDGLGASAVLRAVRRRLTPEVGRSASAAAGLGFSRVFHIDCSKWQSRRAMQKMIAEQLKLPDSVMDMFDAQDEDDNYLGIGKGSRAEIPRVAEEINGQIQKLNGRFLLIFHNGSNEEIDLSSLGFPLFDRYSKSKVLWSFQGRFRAYPRTKVNEALKNTTLTDVFLSAEYSSNIGEDEFLTEILQHEAEEVAREMINLGDIDWPTAAVNCFLYTMELCRMDNDQTDYDLATHVCNYWRCDDIIQLQQGDIGNDDGVDKLWLSCDALHREMRLDADNYRNPHFSSRVERRLLKHVAYWTSPTYGFMRILDPHGQIPEGMFQQFNKLSVLKLSACEFSFASPPFLCCRSLRFLYLDRCQERSSTDEAVEDEERSSTDGAVKEDDTRQFLQRLWVLDVRYSKGAFLSQDMTHLMELNVVGAGDWLDMDLFRGQLCNIRKLRVTKLDNIHLEEVLFSRMEKLELLEFSLNDSELYLRLIVENCNNLESVIIYGSTNLFGIYLKGCPKLKNLFLIGPFPNINYIRIAGGAVEILDLSSVTAPQLDGLCLLECEKLCAILWPSSAERKMELSRLCIDMKQKEGSTADTSRPPGGFDYWRAALQKIKFDWHISVRDARILQSLEPVKGSFGSKDAHVEVSTISPPSHPCADAAAGSKDGRMRSSSGQHVQVKLKQPKDTAMYPDVAVALKEIRTQQQQEEANEGHNSSDAPVTMSICPPRPDLPSEGCYINIEDHLRTRSQAASVTLPGFVCDGAKILHVHDSLHATSILEVPSASATWNQLEWCRVERCPKLECVFGPLLAGGERSKNDIDMFKNLKTVWASGLPNARYIWNWTWTGSSEAWRRSRTFEGLALLHLDCCPRLISIVRFPAANHAFDRLERLEIMWCSDLSVVFHFVDISGGWRFLELKHVYLHELPNLQNICSIGLRILMPELQTIKIRGCWSLKRLPIIKSANMVECDCEKEWWDGLEWESAVHIRQYKPIHPRYYKKTMLRGSALR